MLNDTSILTDTSERGGNPLGTAAYIWDIRPSQNVTGLAGFSQLSPEPVLTGQQYLCAPLLQLKGHDNNLGEFLFCSYTLILSFSSQLEHETTSARRPAAPGVHAPSTAQRTSWQQLLHPATSWRTSTNFMSPRHNNISIQPYSPSSSCSFKVVASWKPCNHGISGKIKGMN